MRRDVLLLTEGKLSGKLVSKETLNHRALIEMVSGLDVYRETPEAYRRAYQALGIDIINRVPLENAPPPTPEGTTRPHPRKPYSFAPLGVYDTVMRHTYECSEPEQVWELDLQSIRYEDLLTPVPHPCRAEDIYQREQHLSDVGQYYPMLYTTLFMAAVEILGWEVFMIAASLDPDRFHDHFILPCVAKSKAVVREMGQASSCPFIFVHDDLASAAGPVFRPGWYDDYIFPHYPEICSEARKLGKKMVFVADGNMTQFLPRLVDAGFHGIMFESPATPVEAVIEHFGAPGKVFIGGVETRTLVFGTHEEIRKMVLDLHCLTRDHAGFALASGGGLNGDIPLHNLEAYFDARVDIGATPEDWRTCCRTKGFLP